LRAVSSWWLRYPRGPLGWMLILAALLAVGLGIAPGRFDARPFGTGTPNVRAVPDPDDDGDDWIVPPPRQTIAI